MPFSTSHRATSSRPRHTAQPNAVVPSNVRASASTFFSVTKYRTTSKWPFLAAQCNAVRPRYALRPVWCVAGSLGSSGAHPGGASSHSKRTHARWPAPALHSRAPAPCLSRAPRGSHFFSRSSSRSARASPRRAASSPGSASASTFPEDTRAASAPGSPRRAAASPAARSEGARTLFFSRAGAAPADPGVTSAAAAAPASRTVPLRGGLATKSALDSFSASATASACAMPCLVLLCHHSARSPATKRPQSLHRENPSRRRAS